VMCIIIINAFEKQFGHESWLGFISISNIFIV